MEEKKDSSPWEQAKRTIPIILQSRHYILAWSVFFIWLYFLNHIRELYTSESSLGITTTSVTLLIIFSIILFMAHHIKIKGKIEKNSLPYYAIATSILISAIFFHSDGFTDNGYFHQQTLANFGTFFGGILTPIGIFLAIWGYRDNSEIRKWESKAKEHELESIKLGIILFDLSRTTEEWSLKLIESHNLYETLSDETFLQAIKDFKNYFICLENQINSCEKDFQEYKSNNDDYGLAIHTDVIIENMKVGSRDAFAKAAKLIFMAYYSLEMLGCLKDSKYSKLVEALDTEKYGDMFKKTLYQYHLEAQREIYPTISRTRVEYK